MNKPPISVPQLEQNGWTVSIKENEHGDWHIIISHPNFGSAAFGCESGTVRAQVLQMASEDLLKEKSHA